MRRRDWRSTGYPGPAEGGAKAGAKTEDNESNKTVVNMSEKREIHHPCLRFGKESCRSLLDAEVALVQREPLEEPSEGDSPAYALLEFIIAWRNLSCNCLLSSHVEEC